LEDERKVSIYLEKSVVRISSDSTEERGIKTSQYPAGIEGNLPMTETKPYQYNLIGKLIYIYSAVITFCA